MSLSIHRRSVPVVDFNDLKLHPVVQRLYAARGITRAVDLDYRLQALTKPDSMLGIEQASARLADAVVNDDRIVICGDFDADGATGTAVAIRALRACGAQQVDYAVPNRFDFGYGLSPGLVEAVKPRQPDLIITVDNGISSLDGVALARQAGIDVIITDHHLPGAQLPAANVIVNPNLPECQFPSKALAGVGVMFYVMAALRSQLQRRRWFGDAGPKQAPNLAELLDLVALGTVADLVPLDANNRRLVAQGLARIRGGRSQPGIRALLDAAGRDMRRVGAGDLGFALGPRLNAAGRLDDMALGIDCLLTDDLDQAREMAVRLDRLNLERREIQETMQQQADGHLADLQNTLEQQENLTAVCLFDEQWHQGVVGLLASKVKDKLHRPTVVFAPADEGSDELKGSVRSIRGYHVRDALADINARFPQLIDKFGGHAMAAGLSLSRRNLPAFIDAWTEQASRSLSEEYLQQVIATDGELASDELSLEVADAIFAAGPWGQSFPEPVFEGQFELIDYRPVGQKGDHLKLRLHTGEQEIGAIAFNTEVSDLPEGSSQLRVLYQLIVNEFRGRRNVEISVQAII